MTIEFCDRSDEENGGFIFAELYKENDVVYLFTGSDMVLDNVSQLRDFIRSIRNGVWVYVNGIDYVRINDDNRWNLADELWDLI